MAHDGLESVFLIAVLFHVLYTVKPFTAGRTKTAPRVADPLTLAKPAPIKMLFEAPPVSRSNFGKLHRQP